MLHLTQYMRGLNDTKRLCIEVILNSYLLAVRIDHDDRMAQCSDRNR